MSDNPQIEIEYVDLNDDAKWMVMHESHSKFLKDWNEVVAYLIRWRIAKELS